MSEQGNDTVSSHNETSTSLSGTINDSTIDLSMRAVANSTVQSDDTGNNGVESNWSTYSYSASNNVDTNDTDSSSVSISGGWEQSSARNHSWANADAVNTTYSSTGGTGNPDNSTNSTVTDFWGDSLSDHTETSTTLSGLNNDSISDFWTSDTSSETVTENNDLTAFSNVSTSIYGGSGDRGGDTTDIQSDHPFSNSSLDSGTEDYTYGTSWSYDYGDQTDLTTTITGPDFDAVDSTSYDSTHNDSGQDSTFTDDPGSDTFNAHGYTPSTGTSTQDSGAEQFGFGEDYSDTYTNLTVSHSNNDGQGHASSNRTITHTDQGSNGWSMDVAGSDTFTMTAADPTTGDTSWDIGAENYTQDQSQSSAFNDISSTTSTAVNGTTTTSSTFTHTGGGTDTLSSGDQIGHNYGDTSIDPTTGDVTSDTGTDNYTLDKFYGDTYTNFSTGPTTTHTDSGSAGATYTDQGTETDLTPTTDPSTGDISEDLNTDSIIEDDGATESFTDQSSLTSTTTTNGLVDKTDSTSHTDNGSDSVSSYDQDTDISSDIANYGPSTQGNSDTTTEWDSSSDSYSDNSSNIETTLGTSVVSVTNSSTYTDLGSDTDTTNDQGTDTSSDGSSDGLESDAGSDTYTNTESSSDNYSDQSYDIENVASGALVSAANSDSSTDSGNDSAWSHNSGTDSPYSISADGRESTSSAKTFTSTECTIDQYADSSYDNENEESSGIASETLSASNSDNETDTSYNYNFGSYANESPTDTGSEGVSVGFNEISTSSLTQTDTSLTSGDDDQIGVTETKIGTSDQTSTDSTTETLSGTDNFTGIDEDSATYSGAGSFTESYLDSTSYYEDDDSDTTLDPSGLLSGTDSLTDFESDTWNDSHQDWDSISAGGSAVDSVTLTAQDSGSTTNPDNETTIYNVGNAGDQGGSTLQTADSNFFSETDPNSTYSDLTTDNSTDTTPVGGDEVIAGGPVETTSGTMSAYFDAAATAHALEDGYAAAPTSLPGMSSQPQTDESSIESHTSVPGEVQPSGQSLGGELDEDAGGAGENQPVPGPGGTDIPSQIEGTVSLGSVPASRLLAMVQDNLAISLNGGAYIYIADTTLDGGLYMMLLQRNYTTQTMSSSSSTYKTVYAWTLPPPPDGDVFRVLRQIRTPERGQLLLGVYEGLSDQAKTEFVANAWTFALNMVPGIASGQAFTNGDYVEGTISLAGDVSFLLSGPLKALDSARGLAQTARASQSIANGIEFTVGSFRTGQGVAALNNGQGQQAAGYFGEATLRFMGIAPAILAKLKARSPNVSVPLTRSGLGAFTNRNMWVPPNPQTSPLLTRWWQDKLAELEAKFNGTYKVLTNTVGPGGITGSYDPVSNVITFYKGATDVSKFEELLHWSDIQHWLDTTPAITRTVIDQLRKTPGVWRAIYKNHEAAIQRQLLNYGFTRVP